MANKGDHCKYAKEFIKAGIDVYSCNSVADKISGINDPKTVDRDPEAVKQSAARILGLELKENRLYVNGKLLHV